MQQMIQSHIIITTTITMAASSADNGSYVNPGVVCGVGCEVG